MDDSMAPPFKKRRLSGSSAPSRASLSTAEPTFVHLVSGIERKISVAQPAPHHVQEIHLRIQKRAAALHERHLHRRQDGTVTLVSEITTVDAAGQTILSTVTNTLPTVTTPSTTAITTGTSTTLSSTSSSSQSTTSLTTTRAPSNGFIGSTTGVSTNSNSSTSTSTSSANSHNSTGTLAFTGTNNGTAHHATGSGTFATKTGGAVVLATLKDGQTKTLTRSNKPYVTTFADGQSTTVCDLKGDCRVSATNRVQSSSTLLQNVTASSTTQAAASTAYVPPGGTAQASPANPSVTAGSNTQDSTSTPPPGTIAGGVVGGAAGIAVILVIVLVLLRWWKRRSQHGHHALPPNSSGLASPAVDDDHTTISRGPGMAERAGLMPFVGAVPALFRHQNRSQHETSASGERGFTRVSGRKLPSAFSGGMSSGGPSSPPPNMPLTTPGYNVSQDRNLSSHSFYRDSHGFYGGEGSSAAPEAAPAAAAVPANPFAEPSPERDSPSPEEEIALSPGPQRTPTVHHGGPYLMEPSRSVPSTPNVAQGTARSGTPTSRFQEDV